MDFVEFEASEKISQPLLFSDDEDEITNAEIEDFIADEDQQEDDVTFNRQLGPENIEDYYKFPNQTRNPKEAVYENDSQYFGDEDTQPKLYDPENREFVGFDKCK